MYAIVQEGPAVLQLLPREYQALLIRRNPFSVFDKLLYSFNRSRVPEGTRGRIG